MKSKAEVIREQLAELRVLDIGGAGYGADNPYEKELREAWSLTKQRFTVDLSDRADWRINLNQLPLPSIEANQWDIATAFDVLEHLEHPVEVLKWIPTQKLLVSLPNSLSCFCRRMEQTGFEHLYSFTWYTAGVLLARGGWKVEKYYYTFGKWSRLAKMINWIGSLVPSRIGTGLVIHCVRTKTEG